MLNRYVTLSRDEQFNVRSRVTGRVVTVVGLNYEWNEIKEYKIKGEGYFDVERFEPADYAISASEFFEMKNELKLLKDKINKEYISKDAILKKILRLMQLIDIRKDDGFNTSEQNFAIKILEQLLEEEDL